MEAPNMKLHGYPYQWEPCWYVRAGGRMDMKEYVGAFRDYANTYRNMLRNYAQHRVWTIKYNHKTQLFYIN